MILGGRSCKTSSFRRRRMNGRTCLWRDSIAKAPAVENVCSLNVHYMFLKEDYLTLTNACNTISFKISYSKPNFMQMQLNSEVVIIFLISKQHVYIPSNFTVKEIYHETMKLNSARAINIGLNYIPASCSLEVLLASLLCRMGLPYLAWNCFSVPRNPGIRKSKRDHRSRTLFWMGVPDRIKRWLQTNCFTALESWNHKRYTVYSGLQLKLCVKE